jgi:hypothetical protein
LGVGCFGFFKSKTMLRLQEVSTAHALAKEMKFYEAADLNTKAQSLAGQGRYAEAEKLQRRALQIKIETMGPNTIHTALTYNALGEVLIKQSRW